MFQQCLPFQCIPSIGLSILQVLFDNYCVVEARPDEIVFIKICHLMFVYMPFGLMVHVSQRFELLVAMALASVLFSTVCLNKGIISFRILLFSVVVDRHICMFS